ETILLDGAIGTELDKRGVMGRGRNNLDHPEIVEQIHRAYADAGCQALTTNTLTMNRIYLEGHRQDVPVEAVNRAGVELARRVAGDRLYVLGDMSSTGQLLEPYGPASEPSCHDAFREQAIILADAGADALIIETMIDLREALCALRACKDSVSLPVLVGMVFQTTQNQGRTIMGQSAADCARQLADAGADGVGTNCGAVEPERMAEIIAAMRSACDLPLLAQPNAGLPRLVGDRTVFDMTPEAFAEGIQICRRAGARLVGGCCGTTPAHIQAIRRRLD
ncbi:MAG: homocysteine S-methyltransferase family protein, partial [Sedimentisphaerales bacterium]|nr:homocysteine S-methyltransferase family protein [Sedimentisphaerales bacterium]